MYGEHRSRGFGLLGILVGLVLLGIVAAVAYNVGLSAGAAGSAGAAPVVYPWFGFGGFPIFGFLFLLLIIGLFLALIFRPRGWGGGYWGHGPWGYRDWERRDVPPPFEPMLENWHRRAHGETPSTAGAADRSEQKPT